jgi:hypothetical protein
MKTYTNIADIAKTLNIDIKTVAKIYEQWLLLWLDAKSYDLDQNEVKKEVRNYIYN